jgi:hypothetical protein
MTIKEVSKEQIYKAIEALPEERLPELLHFLEGLVEAYAAIPVLASNLKSASICIYLEQVKRDGNPLGPLWSQGQEIFQWQRTSSYRQTSYSH